MPLNAVSAKEHVAFMACQTLPTVEKGQETQHRTMEPASNANAYPRHGHCIETHTVEKRVSRPLSLSLSLFLSRVERAKY